MRNSRSTCLSTEHCILHWDSKALADMDGAMHEIEAVTTSGWPQYTEGKMICAVEMVDENGENTSKGEHQAEVVWSNAEQWNIIPRIRGLCFDTTASNAGRIKGAAIVLHQRLVEPYKQRRLNDQKTSRGCSRYESF